MANSSTTTTTPKPAKRPGRGHPLLASTPPGVWNPDAAGNMPGYPLTQEGYDRRVAALRRNHKTAKDAGKLNRRGVPNGWAGQKEEITTIRRNSQTDAERLADDLDTLGMLDPQDSVDACLAREAITALAAIAFDTTQTAATRLTSMGLLLHYVRPKPAQKTAVTLESGADFLSGLAAKAAAMRAAEADRLA